MKATLYSVRIAPKKAQLVAKMVRKMPVLQAIETLEHTNKKAARIIEEVLKSAVANARTNDNQSPDALTITSLTINKAQSYRRGVPMARGRVRPMRKFLSHVHVTLGVDTSVHTSAPKKTQESTSQTTKKAVKQSNKTSSSTKSASTSVKKKTDTTASNSDSARKKSTKSAS